LEEPNRENLPQASSELWIIALASFGRKLILDSLKELDAPQSLELVFTGWQH